MSTVKKVTLSTDSASPIFHKNPIQLFLRIKGQTIPCQVYFNAEGYVPMKLKRTSLKGVISATLFMYFKLEKSCDTLKLEIYEL